MGSNLAKLDSMWDKGTYMGVKGSTGEMIIGTESGVWKTRTVRRRPVEFRWNAMEVDKVKQVLWGRHASERDGEVIESRGGRGVGAGGDAAGREASRARGVECPEGVPREEGGL